MMFVSHPPSPLLWCVTRALLIVALAILARSAFGAAPPFPFDAQAEVRCHAR